MTATAELTPTQLLLVQTAARLRAWVEALRDSVEPDADEDDFRLALADALDRISIELWEAA